MENAIEYITTKDIWKKPNIICIDLDEYVKSIEAGARSTSGCGLCGSCGMTGCTWDVNCSFLN